MDSTLNVQQYIQQTIQQNPADIDLILTPPPDLDDGVWKYEHLRQFCLQLNGLAFMLQEECNPETCIQMTATEQWIFLCAAHKNPKELHNLCNEVQPDGSRASDRSDLQVSNMRIVASSA
ncbi:hypothetical protein OSTOST_20515 [Ostertagia ostertagi]